MSRRLPLPTLLSHALVAFTIEFDNETEHRLPHRTTRHGKTADGVPAPWLVSMAMWFNCMQFVDEQGITLGELRRLARTETNLHGMRRWGYVSIAPDPGDQRARPPKSAWLVRAKPGGQRVRAIWRLVLPIIEERWRERFGSGPIDDLRQSLATVANRVPIELPDCMPILKYGLRGPLPRSVPRTPSPSADLAISNLPLPALLARVLLAFALEFDNESEVSLALAANYLRVLDENPIAVRDLPSLTGASKENAAVAVGFLRRHGYATVASAPAPDRGQQVRLIEKGLIAQDASRRLATAVERRWPTHFGEEAVNALRLSLEQLVGFPTAEQSPLFQGLQPYPDGWRAQIAGPTTLPHYPLVTHRGGYPDGS